MNSQEKSSGTRQLRRTLQPPRRAHPVTLRQVAEAAGVSTATVSLVVNKKKDAPRSPPTPANGCGMRSGTWATGPMPWPKTLVSGSSRFIGLVADSIATTPLPARSSMAPRMRHGSTDTPS